MCQGFLQFSLAITPIPTLVLLSLPLLPACLTPPLRLPTAANSTTTNCHLHIYSVARLSAAGRERTQLSLLLGLWMLQLSPPPAPCNREPPPRCSSYSTLTLCQSSCSHPPTAPYLSLEGPDSFFPTVTSSQNAIHMQMNSRGFAHPIATPNTLRYIPCPSESEVQIIPP